MAESQHAQRKWESGWEGHEQAQFLRMARLTLPQKLDWLEPIVGFALDEPAS